MKTDNTTKLLLAFIGSAIWYVGLHATYGSGQAHAAPVVPGALSVPEEVSAHSFILTDSKGGKRAVLTLDSAGAPVLSMYDTVGVRRVSLAITKGHPELCLYHTNGKISSDLYSAAGNSSLTLNNSQGMPRVMINTNKQAREILLLGSDNLQRLEMDAYSNGSMINMTSGMMKPALTLFAIKKALGMSGVDMKSGSSFNIGMNKDIPDLGMTNEASRTKIEMKDSNIGPDLLLGNALNKAAITLSSYKGDPALKVFNAFGITREALGLEQGMPYIQQFDSQRIAVYHQP